ncbi:DUF4433 domain-containing protein [Cereibacter sphaeroides]|uniref:DarT ssDNA thymidine ADP-ribosyltransferase family protein n=1 Tax=Cereibacter sphaeroides TaxID=1063 RepID=UPI003AF199A3|nr:DUF4433 domain-containing protein [Cereibacter sphaeroides]
MRESLVVHDVQYLLHFTKYSNLEGIMRNGLLRRSELDRRKEAYSHVDDLRLDGHLNSLSISIGFPNYRMFYAARQRFPGEEWVVLGLRADVLIDKTCAFFPRNAASACFRGMDPKFLGGKDSFHAMFGDIGCIRRADLGLPNHFTTDPQAEVLVFDDIEASYIFAVIAQSAKQRDAVFQAYPHLGEKNIVVYAPFFSYRPDYEHWR